MDINIDTLQDLKNFLGELSEEQLKQPMLISRIERSCLTVESVQVLEEDYINPTGDGHVSKSSLMPGGEGYDPDSDIDPETEQVTAPKGTVYFHTDEDTDE